MDSKQTPEQILAEGKQFLRSGDKPRALAHFIMATNLAPENIEAWLFRAKATADPREAVMCLERVMALDPENVQAREDLIYLRMDSLQKDVQTETDSGSVASPSNPTQAASVTARKNMRWFAAMAVVIVLCMVVGIGLTVAVIIFETSPDLSAAAPSPTLKPFISLPATWTPVPTRTPTRTPTPTPIPMGKVKAAVTVRNGPGTNYTRLGSLASGSQVVLQGKSADGKYYEIEYPDDDEGAWIPVDYLEVPDGVDADLPVLNSLVGTSVPTSRPIVVATVKPSNTPLSQGQYEFILARPIRMIADCQAWKVWGTVYNNSYGERPVNGVLVRIWAYNQLQGTVNSGTLAQGGAGYWEWNFARGSEIVGEVAAVYPDGTLRSQLQAFHLTSRCDLPSAVTQVVIDLLQVR